VAKVPMARALLPGRLKVSVKAVEEELKRTAQDDLVRANFLPIAVKVADDQVILYLREGGVRKEREGQGARDGKEAIKRTISGVILGANYG